MVKEVHRISDSLTAPPYEDNGVTVFSYSPGSAPPTSVLKAAGDDGTGNPFPDLGGGFGSSLRFRDRRTAGRIKHRTLPQDIRYIEVEVEQSDTNAAVAEAVARLASQGDANYVVVIRERGSE